MSSPASIAPEIASRRILELERRDRRAAAAELDRLSPEERVAVVCEAPLGRRGDLLGLMSQPEQVIPLLPQAEFCFTAKAIGLADSGWMLEHATSDQLVACLDLDGWQGLELARASTGAWLAALADTGENTLLRASQQLDAELLVLYLRDRARVDMRPGGDDAEDWQPPEGGRTLEGQFYLIARHEGDDLAPLMSMLDTLFRKDYWLYFRILQGAVWELETELEEWALRWRNGRLEDLGFPSWDESMRIYGFVRPERRADLPNDERPLQIEGWDLPVWVPELPVTRESGYSLFRAAQELDAEERRAFFYAFIGLANRIAVADRMPLGDADTLPSAIEKAAASVSRGLDHVATEHPFTITEVLRRVSLERLFQVGASLARDSRTGAEGA